MDVEFEPAAVDTFKSVLFVPLLCWTGLALGYLIGEYFAPEPQWCEQLYSGKVPILGAVWALSGGVWQTRGSRWSHSPLLVTLAFFLSGGVAYGLVAATTNGHWMNGELASPPAFVLASAGVAFVTAMTHLASQKTFRGFSPLARAVTAVIFVTGFLVLGFIELGLAELGHGHCHFVQANEATTNVTFVLTGALFFTAFW